MKHNLKNKTIGSYSNLLFNEASAASKLCCQLESEKKGWQQAQTRSNLL